MTVEKLINDLSKLIKDGTIKPTDEVLHGDERKSVDYMLIPEGKVILNTEWF
jgi:hypothetical protein